MERLGDEPEAAAREAGSQLQRHESRRRPDRHERGAALRRHAAKARCSIGIGAVKPPNAGISTMSRVRSYSFTGDARRSGRPGCARSAGICCPPPTELAWSPDGRSSSLRRPATRCSRWTPAATAACASWLPTTTPGTRTPRWSATGAAARPASPSAWASGRGSRSSTPPLGERSHPQRVSPAWYADGSPLAYTTGAGARLDPIAAPTAPALVPRSGHSSVLAAGRAGDRIRARLRRSDDRRRRERRGAHRRRRASAWSPDGSLLAFSTADGARITRRDGTLVRFAGAHRRMALRGPARPLEDNGPSWSTWSRDGRPSSRRHSASPRGTVADWPSCWAGDSGSTSTSVAPGDRGALIELDPPACAGRTARAPMPPRHRSRRPSRGQRRARPALPRRGDDVVLAGAATTASTRLLAPTGCKVVRQRRAQRRPGTTASSVAKGATAWSGTAAATCSTAARSRLDSRIGRRRSPGHDPLRPWARHRLGRPQRPRRGGLRARRPLELAARP